MDERTLDSDSERRRFLGEARAAGNLSGHPGIVTVHDAGILGDGRPYLVMKLCPGGSLTKWLRPENRQTAEQIRVVGVRIADALAAAHAQGMLHRDVKPANILIDRYGLAGLADFGLAAATEPSVAAAFTPAYAAPESLRGEPPTEAGDVYQLAATLYALLSGRPPRDPIGGRTSLADLLERLDDPVPPLPDVDQEFMQILLDGLSSDPTHRPTAPEFRDRLTALDLSGSARADAPAGPVRTRRLGLRILVASVLALLLIVVTGTGVYLYEIDRSVTANIKRSLALPPEVSSEGTRPQKLAAAKQALDYVLIGRDGGDPNLDGDRGPSDSIMLVHLNAARDHAYVISVPRTTKADIPGAHGKTINFAYNEGKAPLVVSSVENVTGVRVDHVAVVDFRGFVELTNDLGGVTVRNGKAFSSGNFSYAAGDITLKGDAALTFVRDHDHVGDAVRAENQRRMFKAILAKGLSSDAIADPLSFTRFIGNAAKAIQVDDALSDSELRSTALSLRLKPADITLLAMPAQAKAAKQLSNAMRTDTMAAYVKDHPGGG